MGCRAWLSVALAIAVVVSGFLVAPKPLAGEGGSRTLSAQQPQTPPAFSTGADLVQVDVVVQDRDGNFVSDLSLDDFDVQDQGQPQRLEQFYLHLADGSRQPAASRGAADAAAGASAVPPGGPRFFIVVFDDAHLTPGGFKRVQAAATSLFTAHFAAGDVGGVVSNGMLANNRLTSNRDELLKAVKDLKPSGRANARVFDEREWPRLFDIEAIRIIDNNDTNVLQAAIQRACAEDPDSCAKIDPSMEVRTKAQRQVATVRIDTSETLQVLRGVLNALSRIDARKNLLLMSEGFLSEEGAPPVQDAISLAARANTRIYTLDARGLNRGMSDRLMGVNPGADDGLARLYQQFDFESDSTNSLAVDTGGFVVRNTNYFDKAIAQIVSDAGNYYVVGFRPAALDGKYHAISVKLKRAGVAVRARKGYVATAKPAMTMLEPTPAPAALSAAATDADDAVRLPPSPPSGFGATGKADTTTVPVPGPSNATRLRPDSQRHVETLAASAPATAAATQGWDAYQRGDLESARTSLAVAAGDKAARPWVHYALGQAQYGLGDYPHAVDSWERVRQASPEFEPVYFDLVDGYLQQKDYDRAIGVMRDAKARWPRDAQVFEALGVAQIWRTAYNDAIMSFQQAVALAPEEGLGYFNLGKAYELKYRNSRRYVQQLRTWYADPAARQNALANYQRYVSMGGPLEAAAREGISRLEMEPR